MSKFTIFTDVNSDLTKEYLNEKNIETLPIYYRFDDKTIYGDELNLSIKEFFEKMNSGEIPHTMGCNPDRVEIAFREVLKKGEDILCIMFSSAMSCCYNSAIIAKQMLEEEFPDRKILVIDSKNGSMAEGFMVKDAVNLKEEGLDIEKIFDILESNKENYKCICSVSTMDNLVRSGRISHVKGILGNVLNLKPVFEIDKEGKLQVLEKSRGLKKVIKRVCEEIKEFGAEEIAICHANDLEIAEQIKTSIEELNIPITLISDLNYSISANAGQSSFGVSMKRKISK